MKKEKKGFKGNHMKEGSGKREEENDSWGKRKKRRRYKKNPIKIR